MKTKKKYKFLFLPLFPSILFFAVGNVTSCATDVFLKNNHIKEVTKLDVNNRTVYQKLKTCDISIANLLSGSASVNSGNYLVIIGSTSWTSNNILLHNNEYSNELLWSGLLEIFSYFESLSKLADWVFPTPTKIFIYQDIAIDANCSPIEMNSEIDANSEIQIAGEKKVANISDPYNKWKDMGDNATSVQKARAGKYVRQDESAIDFRNLIDNLNKVFNGALTGKDLVTAPIVIGYKYDYQSKKVIHKFKNSIPTSSGSGDGSSENTDGQPSSFSSEQKKFFNSYKKSVAKSEDSSSADETTLIDWIKSFYSFPDK